MRTSRLSHSNVLLKLKSIRCTSCRSYTTSPPSAPYNILLCGTDTFACASLSSLIAHRSSLCSTLHVLTPPDTSQSWGAARMKISPVKQLALSHSLPHHHVPSSGMSNYDLPSDFPITETSILITCSFGHMIPNSLLDTFSNPWQRINIHPSLLPQLRGAAPIQWALARRMNNSGISIQTLEKGRFDTGRILAQESFPFPPQEVGEPSFLQVEKVMADRAAKLLIRLLSNLASYWNNSWPQNEQERNLAPKLKPTFSRINWQKWTAQDIVAREKAFAYLYPLSTTLNPHPTGFRSINVNFADTSIVSAERLRDLHADTAKTLLQDSVWVGSAVFSPTLDGLVVKTVGGGEKGAMLVVNKIKTEGKKVKIAAEWFKAYKDRAEPLSGVLRFQ